MSAHPEFRCIARDCAEIVTNAAQLCAAHEPLEALHCRERHPITENRCMRSPGHQGGHTSKFKPPLEGVFSWSWRSAIHRRRQTKGRR